MYMSTGAEKFVVELSISRHLLSSLGHMSELNQRQSNITELLVPSNTNDSHKCVDSPSARQRLRLQPYTFNASNKLLDEKVLLLIFEAMNWNPFLICFCSCVCKKFNAIANRVLWKQFCLSRAPGMVEDLLRGTKGGRINGEWHALGRLLIRCAGCHSTGNFEVRTVPGHVVLKSRFSKTSGKSFLVRECRTDVLYVTDPCEHEDGGFDIGLFRGVFRNFGESKTRKLLIDRKAEFDGKEVCSFCRAKVWSMATAKLIPRSASRRLAAYEEKVEYFICHNGHLNGKCSLLHLSDSEDDSRDGYDE